MTDVTSDDARALYEAAQEAGHPPLLLNAGTWAVDGDVLQQLARAASYPVLTGFRARAATRRDATGQPAVAVIPLTGVITPQGSFFDFLFGGGGGGLAGFRAQLDAAVSNGDVESIVLDVDSPGGLADMVPETAAAVRAAAGAKSVTAVVDTMMGSAAYWIGSQASEVVVSPSAYAGSIGVYRMHVDYSKMNEFVGMAVTYVSAGKHKTEGNPDEPLGDGATRAWQASVDDVYDDFVSDVALGRGASEAAVRAGYGEGRMLRGERAVTAGLADRVATFEEVLSGLVGAPVQTDPAPPPVEDDEDDGAAAPGRRDDAVLSREARLTRARLLTA